MTFNNLICPVCGASCDDIAVDLNEDALTVKNACKMGNAKFQEIVSKHRIRQPFLNENGRSRICSWDEAISRAAEILAGAKRPLLFMGSETSCEAMEVGLHLGRAPGRSG